MPSSVKVGMDKKGNYVVGMLKHVKAMSDTSECEFLPSYDLSACGPWQKEG